MNYSSLLLQIQNQLLSLNKKGLKYINIDALPYADIVFSSLTKSFAGRGDILAGSLVINKESHWRKEIIKAISISDPYQLSDPDAIALEQASRDVTKRIPKLNQA